MMQHKRFGRIDIVMPVHNEGESIAQTLREFHDIAGRGDGLDIRFVISEDGSVDQTVPVIKALSKEIPILLLSEPVRKGYSRAVVDGFRAADAEWVGFVDSDGQCDPHDLVRLVEKAKEGFDYVVGYRNPRSDHWIRLLMSSLFGLAYRRVFDVPLRDPSCPFLLVRRATLLQILRGELGILKQGFWWEFNARMFAAKLKCAQLPVNHRVRAAGQTQVYRVTTVPRIAYEHLKGLLALKRELRAGLSVADPV